jgi:hypothetical protein
VEIMSGDISTLFYRRPGWSDVRDLYPGPVSSAETSDGSSHALFQPVFVM